MPATVLKLGRTALMCRLRLLIAALALPLTLAGCSLEALLPATATSTPTIKPTFTPSYTPTATLSPTATATSTATNSPTATPTASATSTPSATPTVYGLVRAQGRINVRSGPGTEFGIRGSLAPDSGVQVIGQNDDGDWYQIRREDGDEGWVSGRLLRIVEPPLAAEADDGEAQVISEETRIRVALGDAQEAGSDDGILVINIPIADGDAMRLTATELVGADMTATAHAAPAVPPAPTISPTAEPPTAARPQATPRYNVNVFAFCNDPAFGIAAPANLTAGSTIKIFWAWFASTEAYLRQHMVNATHELRVDGAPIENVNLYRLNPTRSGAQHVVYWYVPYGPLEAGPHVITYRVTWRSPISDGYASYGPGTGAEFEEESCNFVVR